MTKYKFVEALDDKLFDDSTIYVFKFRAIDAEENVEITFTSNNSNCLFDVLRITSVLMGEEISEVSTDDFFSIAAGYTEIEGEFLLDDCAHLRKI